MYKFVIPARHVVLILMLPLVETSTPSAFIEEFNGYRSVCKKLGWEPKQDCTATHVIAFHASLKSHLNNVPVNATITFGNVDLNMGNGYNPETGVFTAPEDGVYSLAWSYLSRQGGTVYVAAAVDNVDRVFTCIENQQSKFISTSGHLLHKLKRGNQVWIRVFNTAATFIHGGYYSYFSGSKINSF
ncbi:complement C1q subcomponent subunit B-like isoform X2 [Ostrea edulis]|nr:complement C1q subcomponent subunit B-like isoform X2 [Ostrea edulis]XP_048743552.2 complement C1q subcomponent subunit B-like isoform X2 [Ostrea edulis]